MISERSWTCSLDVYKRQSEYSLFARRSRLLSGAGGRLCTRSLPVVYCPRADSVPVPPEVFHPEHRAERYCGCLLYTSFQSLWNTTGGPFIYDEKIKLLPTILNQVVTAGIARAGSGAAASVVMMIPPFIIFIILQSRIIETMAFSGIKG